MNRRTTTRSRNARSSRWVRRAGWCATLAVLVAGCDRKDDANTFAPPPPPEVIVAHPVSREVVQYITYTGVVEASESVELRARVEGFLQTIQFEPGQMVRKGDLLFVLDKSQYQAAVAQSQAAVEAGEAGLQSAESQAKLARELADQRAGPEIDAVIKAATREQVAAELALAKARLYKALLDLSYCEIHAPIDGRITRNLVDAGNLVGRGETTLLATIVLASPAFVSVDISESDVLAVRKARAAATEPPTEQGKDADGVGRPCELALGDESDFTHKGRIDYVAPALDTASGTLQVRTVYENADDLLVPGLFSRVRFPVASGTKVVAPDAALLSDQQGRYAMVVNRSDEVEVRRVKIGALDGDMRVVEEGLSPEDRLIVLGVLRARPGAKVTPKIQPPAETGS